jgi:hypothetical protein
VVSHAESHGSDSKVSTQYLAVILSTLKPPIRSAADHGVGLAQSGVSETIEKWPFLPASPLPQNKSIGQMKMAYAIALQLNMPKGIANGQAQLLI